MPTPPLLAALLLALALSIAVYGNALLLTGRTTIEETWAHFVFPAGAAAAVILASWSVYRTFWQQAGDTTGISLTVIGLCALLWLSRAVIHNLPWRIRCRRAPWANRS